MSSTSSGRSELECGKTASSSTSNGFSWKERIHPIPSSTCDSPPAIHSASRASGVYGRFSREPDKLLLPVLAAPIKHQFSGTIYRVFGLIEVSPMSIKMKRDLPSFVAALAVITVALVLFGAKLTSGASRVLPEPIVGPELGAQLVASAAEDTAVFAGGGFWGGETRF